MRAFSKGSGCVNLVIYIFTALGCSLGESAMNMKKGLFFLLSLTLCCGTANAAAIIDFNTLPGNNGDPFASYTENGFTVASTAGGWKVGKLFGNPIPDVFCPSCGPGTLEVTGGQFLFNSVDIGNPGAPAFSFTITGFLSGNQVLTETGNSPATLGFETVNSINTSQLLDTLFISINTSATDGNIDNIALTSSGIPEPASLLLFGTALIGLGAFRRRQS